MPEREEIEQQMDRILASQDFRSSDKLSAFLKFVVTETLAGRSKHIKGYTVATKVFERPPDFDPTSDPIVRIQAGRLRRRLDTYYHTAGSSDPVVIDIPKGNYAAVFSERSHRTTDSNHGSELTDRPTIAVLPFNCIGGEEDAEILADGITEELTVGFTRFMSLAVLGRQSTERFRETNASIERVASELGARFIVTGSVRRLNDTIRLATQLTDATDSVQLWAKTMEADLSTTGIRAVEDAITANVLARIGDEVGAIPRRLVRESRAKPPESLSAYEATLAFYRYNFHVDPDSYDRTFAALKAAVENEPGYALAWAQLAEMYVDAEQLGFDCADDPLEMAGTFAQRAIDLDPTCQQALSTLSYVNFSLHDHNAAISAAEKAISLNPNSSYQVATAAFWMGLSGELKRGKELINKAAQLNPHGPGWLRLVPLLWYLDNNDLAAALDESRQFRSPNLAWGALLRASVGAINGEDLFAASSYRELKALFPEVVKEPEPYIQAFVHFTHLKTALLEGLKRASQLAD